MAGRDGTGRRLRAARSVSWGRWLREAPSALVPLAIAIGAITGLGAVGFRWLVTAFTQMFTGYADYSGLGRVASTHWPQLGFWFLLLAPVIAGAVYGPLVHRFAPEARGHGVPEVMYAVSHRGGRIAPQVSLVKALASALCIGGGGSVGREGPIVQIGSAAGSTLAQVLRLDVPRMRLLVACGAAAGISATFNAPLAAPFFALELILRNFAAESFGAVVLSSVTAGVVGRAILGDHPFLALPAFAVRSTPEYLLYAALGVAVGIIGVAFSKILYLVEDLCDWVWRGPEWARPAAGGVVLGGLLIALPEMYGVGYPVLENAVEGHYLVGVLLILMVGKMLATSLTIGIGGSGGVFAPTLFIGAMAGTAFGTIAHQLFPAATESAGAYGLIGMGAALGGATGAPITAVIMLFELTGQYSIILPLMVAVVIAAGTGRLLSKNTIYTAKLWRRGVDLDAAPVERDWVAADVAVAAPTPLIERTTLKDAAAALAATALGMLPVVDDDRRYLGCVSAQAVTEALADPSRPHDIAPLIAVPPAVHANTPADGVLATLSGRGGTGLPVLDDEEAVLIGWITYESVLATRHDEPRRKPDGEGGDMRIAISGAGVAGPALAYWLHRAGHEPTLVERAPHFRTGGYIIDFWGVGYRVAEKMGIDTAVRDAGYQVTSLRSVGADGRVQAEVRTDAIRRAAGDKYTSLPRGDLAAAIYSTIENSVETIFSDTITAVHDHSDGVRLEFEHGLAREFDLLVGADGLHSTVRELTFGPENQFERYLGAQVAACVVDGYRPRDELIYVTHNLPGRQVARFSLRDNRTLFLFVFRSDRDHEFGDSATTRARLRREFGDAGWECPQILDALDDADDLYVDVVSQIRMDRWSRGRVALIGDAAACVSLLAGEGTGLAMTEAYVLAGELTRAGGDHRRAFDAYENRLRRFIEGKQDGAQKFLSFFATRTPMGIRVRNLAMRAMNVPVLADVVLNRSLRDDLELPDYAM